MTSRNLGTERDADRSRAVAEIAFELQMPIDDVDRVFQRELGRLTARARIRQFIPTLAVRNTRQLLRELRMRRRSAPRTEPAASP